MINAGPVLEYILSIPEGPTGPAAGDTDMSIENWEYRYIWVSTYSRTPDPRDRSKHRSSSLSLASH